MTYYAFIENNEINGVGQCPCLNEEIQNIEIAESVYNSIIEDKDRYIWDGVDVVANTDYEEIKANKRKKEFENKFLLTSKGNYRLQPKGYSNAQQSIDTVNGMVNAIGSLNERIARMVIFYPTPILQRLKNVQKNG